MKKFSVRIKAVLVAAAFVVSLSLASCTSFLKEASLSTATVEDNAVLPVVSGFFQSDSINEKLRDAFLPVANQMAQISDDSDGRIRVEYTMTEQKEGLFGSKYAVTMYLSDDSDSIELKTVNISGLNTVKAADLVAVVAIHDGTFPYSQRCITAILNDALFQHLSFLHTQRRDQITQFIDHFVSSHRIAASR